MRVTAKVKESTDRTIRAVARKLFIRKGLETASTRQIAAAARVAVGTLFNYYPSKEALAVAIAADEFAAGRNMARARLEARSVSLEEDLFTLIACDIRALEPIRAFIADVLEAGLSLVVQEPISREAAAIRTDRLEDATAALHRHGLGDAATAPIMHLYWSLYLGVLAFWAADSSPKHEDTWALLDRSVRMFTGALRPPISTTTSDAAPTPAPAALPESQEVTP